VIGIIGIVYSSLGVLGGCCGIGAMYFMPDLIEWIEDFLPAEQAEAMGTIDEPSAWMIVSSVVAVGLAAFLLTGSIRVLRRRASGVQTCKIWAVVSIPWTVVALVIGWTYQPDVPTTQDAAYASGMMIGNVVGSCGGLLFGWAFPIFLLIWFSRSKIKAEVAEWT